MVLIKSGKMPSNDRRSLAPSGLAEVETNTEQGGVKCLSLLYLFDDKDIEQTTRKKREHAREAAPCR